MKLLGRFGAVLVIGCITVSIALAANQVRSASTGEIAADNLPNRFRTGGEQPLPCIRNGRHIGLAASDSSVENRLNGDQFLYVTLRTWLERQIGVASGCSMIDVNPGIRYFQEAVRTPVTGVLSNQDVDILEAALKKARGIQKGDAPDMIDLVVERLPKPRIDPGPWKPTCSPSRAELSGRAMRFENQTIESSWKSDLNYQKIVRAWGYAHLNMPRGVMCPDFPFIVSELQSAYGRQSTGILTQADFDDIQKAVKLGAGRHTVAMQEYDRRKEDEARRKEDDARRRADDERKQQELVLQAYNTGVTIFGVELGKRLPDLPDCRFSKPTCITTSNMSAELFFSQNERPAILIGDRLRINVAVIAMPNGAQDYRVNEIRFRIGHDSVIEFEKKFGKASVASKRLQNIYGASWENRIYTWLPHPNAKVILDCNQSFGDENCHVLAAVNTADRERRAGGRQL